MKYFLLVRFVGLLCSLVDAGFAGEGNRDVSYVKSRYQARFTKRRFFFDLPNFDDYGDYGFVLM